MNAILIMFHLELDAGYAMDNLIGVFLEMSELLVKSRENVYISFTDIQGKSNKNILNSFNNIIEYDPASADIKNHEFMEKYVRENKIDIVFGFDQPVSQPAYKYLRRAGVKNIISYQGAPMSDLNSGIKLFLKKLQVSLTRYSPDHFIFESKAMAETAYNGRGIAENKTSVVYLGVDTEYYKPCAKKSGYAHAAFSIPLDRKIIYYSGHMEARKGVAVLVNAALHLCCNEKRKDFHFLLLGNRAGEEKKYLEMLQGSDALSHVTFGGYRNDIAQILPSCDIGAIASTGWDSFTLSSLEIASCGLPLIVSDLQGLVETIEEGKTGLSFEPGNHVALAEIINKLLDDDSLSARLGKQARERVLSGYSKKHQLERLVEIVHQVDMR